MNIRKIIKEEINDFDWVRDVEIVHHLRVEMVHVGLRVRILNTSGYYYGDETSNNPKDMSGTVIDLFVEDIEGDGLWVIVKWDNGNQNTYSHEDLTVAPN